MSQANEALDKMAENARQVGLDYEPVQQEPVAWMFQHDETGRMNYVGNDGIHSPAMFLEMNPRYALVCPLYTAPPQRPWQGLTDEEIEQGCKESWVTEQAWQSAVWWAEAKLKEKNTWRP